MVNLYRGAGVKNIEVVFYKDARHEVLNELGRLETYGDISRWLEAQLTAQAEAADEQTARQGGELSAAQSYYNIHSLRGRLAPSAFVCPAARVRRICLFQTAILTPAAQECIGKSDACAMFSETGRKILAGSA